MTNEVPANLQLQSKACTLVPIDIQLTSKFSRWGDFVSNAKTVGVINCVKEAINRSLKRNRKRSGARERKASTN